MYVRNKLSFEYVLSESISLIFYRNFFVCLFLLCSPYNVCLTNAKKKYNKLSIKIAAMRSKKYCYKSHSGLFVVRYKTQVLTFFLPTLTLTFCFFFLLLSLATNNSRKIFFNFFPSSLVFVNFSLTSIPKKFLNVEFHAAYAFI